MKILLKVEGDTHDLKNILEVIRQLPYKIKIPVSQMTANQQSELAEQIDQLSFDEGIVVSWEWDNCFTIQSEDQDG
jgi:hypothetical protein